MRTVVIVLVLAALCFAQSPGWTSGSKINDQGNGLFDMGAEALMPTPFGHYDLPFQVPAGHSVVRFQGTVSWAASCQGDALMALFIGGQRYGTIILKTKNGAAVNEFFDYSAPIPTGTGVSRLHIEANPQCAGSYAGYSSFEIQATLQVE